MNSDEEMLCVIPKNNIIPKMPKSFKLIDRYESIATEKSIGIDSNQIAIDSHLIQI